jgi:hypothetical protein
MTKRKNFTLWTLQALIAALFLFAGGMKLVIPAAVLAQQMPLPVWFVRFIGVAEVCGAMGLILPGIFRIQQHLTSLAAAGLSVIMAGAAITTLATGGGILASIPFVIGVLTVFVSYLRAPLTSVRSRSLSRESI